MSFWNEHSSIQFICTVIEWDIMCWLCCLVLSDMVIAYVNWIRNCMCSYVYVPEKQSFQGKDLSSAILGDWSRDGLITVTGLLEAVNLQVLSMLRAPVLSALQAGSKGQWNSPNLQARQERRWYCHLTDGMLKHVHAHLKAPLSRKAAEEGTEID